jgi:hypothetical protein
MTKEQLQQRVEALEGEVRGARRIAEFGKEGWKLANRAGELLAQELALAQASSDYWRGKYITQANALDATLFVLDCALKQVPISYTCDEH